MTHVRLEMRAYSEANSERANSYNRHHLYIINTRVLQAIIGRMPDINMVSSFLEEAKTLPGERTEGLLASF